jgi:hypothetical protein
MEPRLINLLALAADMPSLFSLNPSVGSSAY